MISRSRRWFLGLALLLMATGSWAGEDPFGAGDAPAKPAGPPAEKLPAAKEKAEETFLEREKNPVVLAIRDSKPTKPDELMFAVRTLFDIGRTDEAKVYLKKLLESKPDQDTLVALNKKYGSPFFYQMARDHRLKPESEQLGKLVMDAAYASARDPERLRRLVQEINDPLPVRRYEAMEQLRGTDTAALAPLFAALADRKRAAEHPRLRAAILDLGHPMVAPLIGALECPDPGLRAQIIEVLGRFQTRHAISFLMGPCLLSDTPEEVRLAAERAMVEILGQSPGRYEAEQFLHRQVKGLLLDGLPGTLDPEGKVELWQWDEKEKTCVVRRYTPRDAGLRTATRLANDLYRLAPEKAEVRRLFLAVILEVAKLDGGLNRPLPRGKNTPYAQAAAFGASVAEDLLVFAMDNQRIPAALAATELLGELGGTRVLQSAGERPSPLVLALQHGDRRLRLAAARHHAVGPETALRRFQLPDRGIRFSHSQRRHPACVGGPSPSPGVPDACGAARSQIGFDADSVRTGKELFRQATGQPDCEFVLISDAIDFPNLHETIQMLRRDPRTSRLPIGIMARESYLRQSEHGAEPMPLVLAFPRPHDVQSLAYQTSRLEDLGQRERVLFEERLGQAMEALDHLGHLAQSPRVYSFYDLYRHQSAVQAALATAKLSEKAAVVLGCLGSPQAQRALVGLASQHARPLAERQAAAKAFASAVQGHGLLLTRDEIQSQYERYNLSETQDAETQQVMGSLLDTIEAPSKKTAGEKPDERHTASEPAK